MKTTDENRRNVVIAGIPKAISNDSIGQTLNTPDKNR
jgi:hypothetical protein